MTKHEEVTTTTDETGLDALDPATTPARSAEHHRRIVAAVEGVDQARSELDAAVAAARSAGDSWTIIGSALGVTKQAASERFGDRVKRITEGTEYVVRGRDGASPGRHVAYKHGDVKVFDPGKKRAPKRQP